MTKRAWFSTIDLRSDPKDPRGALNLGYLLKFATEEYWVIGMIMRAALDDVRIASLDQLTEKILERVLQVRQVNLVNLLLGRPLVCELLGPNCTPERLAAAVAELTRNERVRTAHRQGYDEVRRRLEAGGAAPSMRAADQILEIVAAHRCGGPALTAVRRNSPGR